MHNGSRIFNRCSLVPDQALAGLLSSCQVRVHPRARHVRLRLDPREGLIVTVPSRFDQRRIPALLLARADWIRLALQRQTSARADVDPKTQGKRPQTVELPALARRWEVVYHDQAGQRLTFSEEDRRLIIGLPRASAGSVDERVATRLRRWLMDQAKAFLNVRVASLANDYGLTYRKIRVRNQRARWGSCSASGDLSLNARLLFCPQAACDYVITHELVHTVHPNHSAEFWAQVAHLLPDYQSRQNGLRQVWLSLPDWI